MGTQTLHNPARARLDLVVTALWPELSRARASALIKAGDVFVDGEVWLRPSAPVAQGARVSLHLPQPTPSEVRAQDLPLHIVYEDADVVVVDKAAGVVVHPAAGHADGTLVNALLHHVDGLSGVGGVSRPGIVHRLDKGTSGLLVVAKHDLAHRGLQAQFAEHSAGRTYLAVALGVPRDACGTIRSFLGRHPKDRQRFASVDEAHGREAITHWERLQGDPSGVSLLKFSLETGRTHQIRVHASEAGWPLLGDGAYARRKNPPKPLRALAGDGDRPMLHAWRLRFTHPTSGEACTFETPPPPDFLAVLAALDWSMPS